MTDVQLLYNEADIKGRIYESTKKFMNNKHKKTLKKTDQDWLFLQNIDHLICKT